MSFLIGIWTGDVWEFVSTIHHTSPEAEAAAAEYAEREWPTAAAYRITGMPGGPGVFQAALANGRAVGRFYVL